jgi:hypothetical protein
LKWDAVGSILKPQESEVLSIIRHRGTSKIVAQRSSRCPYTLLLIELPIPVLKQTKRKHQLTIKTCIKYVDKKSPVMRPNLQSKIYKSPVVA